jgi:hypothetical protein
MSAYAVKHVSYPLNSQPGSESHSRRLSAAGIQTGDAVPASVLILKVDTPDLEPHWAAAIDVATD